MARSLLIVDDDLLSREILSVVAEEAGFTVIALDSGEAALAHLALNRASPPSALLVDMQMPGLSGDALAQRLRPACGAEAVLLAMSGHQVAPQARQHFDGFLLKPFLFEAFVAAFAHAPEQTPPPPPSYAVLSEATYASLAQSMSQEQLKALYTMCLADTDRRLILMRKAVAEADPEAFRRAAHAVKGSCGMVGALELASLAGAMEEDGPQAVSPIDHLDPFSQFVAAAARLRSMLDAKP